MEERSHERVRLPQDALGLRKGNLLEVVSDGSCEGREAEELVYVEVTEDDRSVEAGG